MGEGVKKPVRLDGSFPALRPCRYCESTDGFVSEPKGPHGNGVICAICFRHLGWLPKPKKQPVEDDFHHIED